MNFKKNTTFYYTLLLLLTFYTQLQAQKVVDSLKDVSYDYMWERYYADTTRAAKIIYIDAIIAQTKKEGDTINLLEGYELKSKIYKDENKIKYLDSIINLNLLGFSKKEIAKNFMLRGISYYVYKNDLKKALLDFIKVEEYNGNDIELKRRNYNHIGIVKLELDDKLGALDSYKKSLNMLRLENEPSELSYLSLYFNLSTIYNQIAKLDSANYYINQGITLSKKTNHMERYHNFMINKGINYYYAKKYDDALEIMQYYLDSIKNIHNIAHTHLYLGKINKKVNNWNKVLFHYKSTNKIIDSIKSYDLIYREMYVDLIEYYEKKNNLKKQYQYLNKLIKFDSINNDREVYLNRNLFTDYEIPKLKAERDQIISNIKEKNQQKKIWIIVLLAGSILILSGFIYQYYKRKSYQTKFLTLYNDQENKQKEVVLTTIKESSYQLDISEEIIAHILEGLQQYESNQDYISAELTLPILAKELQTNSKYLSKVISTKKGKTFVQYINGLRVNYAIKMLKDDLSFRKYTLLAIANEVGFKKTESFTKAFKKETGITPSYFIKELQYQDQFTT